MRTGIYVYEPSTVTIGTKEERAEAITLEGYGRADGISELALGTHQLQPGIYRIDSKGPIEITGVSGEIVAVPNDKDDWPDPKPNVIALVPGASAASIRAFFPKSAKDDSPGD